MDSETFHLIFRNP